MPRKRKAKGKPKKSRGGVSGGFHTTNDKTLAGQEDAEWTTMVFETTSAFTSTAGAASYLQIKGNSIFHPYPGVSTSPAGYARMYTQYLVAQVESCRCDVTVWSGVSGQDEPFRIIVLPCTNTQYTVYSAYSNVSSLASVPHAVQGLFSPGGKMPHVSAHGTNSTVIYGTKKGDSRAEAISGSLDAVSGADPVSLWYFLVGYQNFAGTTTTNQQAQVRLSFKVKWFKPIATAEQALDVDFYGNEKITNEVIARLRGRTVPCVESKLPHKSDGKLTQCTSAEVQSRPSPAASRQEEHKPSWGLVFGEEADPESDDPEEVLFRKMLSARLGTTYYPKPKPLSCADDVSREESKNVQAVSARSGPTSVRTHDLPAALFVRQAGGLRSAQEESKSGGQTS